MLLGKTEHFRLEKEGKYIFLMHDDEVLIEGCDRLIDFAVRLPITEMKELNVRLPILKALDVTKKEKLALEELLSNEILKGNVCFDSPEFSDTDFSDDPFGD